LCKQAASVPVIFEPPCTSAANAGQITCSYEPVICGSSPFNEALDREYVSEVEVQLYTFSTYVLERNVRSASHPPVPIGWEARSLNRFRRDEEQECQSIYNVALRRVRVTIVVVEKQ
jgi:hypothetical protein